MIATIWFKRDAGAFLHCGRWPSPGGEGRGGGGADSPAPAPRAAEIAEGHALDWRIALWLRDVMGWKQAGSKGLMPKPYGALPSPPAHAPRIPRARA